MARGVSDDAFTTSVRIGATPDEVFPYLTDPELIVRWMGDWAELRPAPGGVFALDINGVPVRGEYVVIDAPHRLVLTWGIAGHDTMPPGSTTVEIVLRPDAGGTVVELAHRGLPSEEVPQHGMGWSHFLARLAITASGGDPGPDPWASRER